jgi:hypothetical protein
MPKQKYYVIDCFDVWKTLYWFYATEPYPAVDPLDCENMNNSKNNFIFDRHY